MFLYSAFFILFVLLIVLKVSATAAVLLLFGYVTSGGVSHYLIMSVRVEKLLPANHDRSSRYNVATMTRSPSTRLSFSAI